LKKIILDSNTWSSYLAGDRNVLDALAAAESVYMSVIIIGELFSGFRGGKKEKQNRDILDRFLAKPTVNTIQVSAATTEIFGEIKHSLRMAGTPLPINDIWLAAHTVETGSVLVTYDSHFKKVPGLRLWLDIM